jgi:hypothetical protein
MKDTDNKAMLQGGLGTEFYVARNNVGIIRVTAAFPTATEFHNTIPNTPINVYTVVVREITPSTIIEHDGERTLKKNYIALQVQGTLVIRGHGMSFIDDNHRAFRLREEDVRYLSNGLLKDMGVEVNSYSNIALEATGTVFQNLVSITAIHHCYPST